MEVRKKIRKEKLENRKKASKKTLGIGKFYSLISKIIFFFFKI